MGAPLVRAPVAAGSFYPADPAVLGRTVDGLLGATTAGAGQRPWGIVVPHAGYRYSGPVAAIAYAAVRPWADRIARILLVGPAHFVPLEGCAATAANAWHTPLGDLAVDDELRDAAASAGCVLDDEPHALEHSLEVQLPFLARILGAEVRILPVAAGRTSAREVAAVLEALSPLTDLVVISTDLSHYLDLASARAVDRRTADAVLAREPDAIGPIDACGIYALRGAVAFARASGREISLLDLRTSGDTAGDPERVVGYGAFAIA